MCPGNPLGDHGQRAIALAVIFEPVLAYQNDMGVSAPPPHQARAGLAVGDVAIASRRKGAQLRDHHHGHCQLSGRCRFKTQTEARSAVFAFIEGFYKSATPSLIDRVPLTD